MLWELFMRPPKTQVGLFSIVVLVCFLSSPVTHAQENNAELLKKLDYLQQQIDDLKQQLAKTQTQAVETDAKVEAVAEAVETAPLQADQQSKTTIGGYGELHYNNLSAEDSSHDVDSIDFHRFVLFFGHEFKIIRLRVRGNMNTTTLP